jgi:hypothetical protein
MPHIAVINETTGPSAVTDDEVRAMLPAFTQQWNHDLCSVWNVERAKFSFVPAKSPAPPASWWLVFLNDSDQASALAYHDLTNDGMPISKVFVATLKKDKASVSVGATHELCEMAVDPWLSNAWQDRNGVFWATEICDPVESDEYGYEIGGVLVTDFVTPAWFSYKGAHGLIDLKGHAHTPFEVMDGGYAQRFVNGQWEQVTGMKARNSRHATAAKGSRRERRTRRGDWQLSLVQRHDLRHAFK